MRKILITIYCLFVLSACSNENKVHPLIDALNSEGIHVTEINTSEDAILGVKGIVFKLDNDEIIRVYDFGSKENRVKGEKKFKDNQKLLSSHAPIVYPANQYLMLYYYTVSTNAQELELTETKFGEKLQNAIDRIK